VLFRSFKLGDEYFGIIIELIENIERLTPFTRVPKAASYIKGVMNLRGEIIPVIDIKERLHLGSYLKTEDTRVLIINWKNDFKVGFLVDEVFDVINISKDSIEQVSKDKDEFKWTIAKYNHILVNLLNVEDILFDKIQEV